MATITCKVPAAMAAQLDALARGERRTKSAVLREALEARSKDQRGSAVPRAFDLVKHPCGVLQGEPTDLATNPDHLHGFGDYPVF